jgi:hypothetical protein
MTTLSVPFGTDTESSLYHFTFATLGYRLPLARASHRRRGRQTDRCVHDPFGRRTGRAAAAKGTCTTLLVGQLS